MAGWWKLGASSVLTIAAALAMGQGCLSRRDNDQQLAAQAKCASCHGDPKRSCDTSSEAGSAKLPEECYVYLAAPPHDLSGHKTSDAHGVGAHQIHLNAGKIHAPIACSECHVVPKTIEDKGHADNDLPADLSFGPLASGKIPQTNPDAGVPVKTYSPSYDPGALHCSDTYCHRDSDAVWNKPRDASKPVAEGGACGTCHGLPPNIPSHPQNDNCYLCHAETVDANKNIIDPSKHVDGVVEVITGKCDICHGGDSGNAAPPKALNGDTAVSALGVGAHQAHLAGGANSRPVQCTECHVVPKDPSDPGHLDPPDAADNIAELTFSGVAVANNRKPVWDRTIKKCSDAWCHSPVTENQQSPEWTSTTGHLPCNGCHGTPPALPHPQMTRCSLCHGEVVNDDNVTIKDKSKHVNGEINVVDILSKGCNFCHGGLNPDPNIPDRDNAPPYDTAGNTANTSPGVGAHQAHLTGNGEARPVLCTECHIVPSVWTDPGHIDTALPADVVFSGLAVLYGATPSFDAGTGTVSCKNTYCHGAVTADPGLPVTGSSHEPVWTDTLPPQNEKQARCGTCHGFPPTDPVKHPDTYIGCPNCHHNLTGSLDIIDPSLHINGYINVY